MLFLQKRLGLLGLAERNRYVEQRWNPFMMCLLAFLLAFLIEQTVYSDELSKKRLQPKIEPKYVSETPGYLLLVFGLEATRSVWIVADNEFVYIDRTGIFVDKNRDISGQSEDTILDRDRNKLSARKFTWTVT